MKRIILAALLAWALTAGAASARGEAASPDPGSVGTAQAVTAAEAEQEADSPEDRKPDEELRPKEMARDLSRECLFDGRSGEHHELTDGSYARDYRTRAPNGLSSLRVTAPEGEVVGAVYIQWHSLPRPLLIQVPGEGDEWVTVSECDGDFYAQYIPIPELSDFRLVCREDPSERMEICEMKVLSPGTPPEDIQLWQKPGDKVDMMLIVGHPDDELLWFGGLLPYYGGELGKNVLVICAAMNRSIRRLELLDALWACGVRTHPIHCMLYDFTTGDMKEVLHKWGGEEKLEEMFTGFYRRYKPDVVVLHDVNGEYGHGIHRAVSWLGRKCAELSKEAWAYPEQAELYGLWDVPKIYIHLYPENQIRMDWHQPLKTFGGKTALKVAQEAMLMHKTQIEHGWAVQDGGEMDNELYGLYRTLVGPDLQKNDLMENIPAH